MKDRGIESDTIDLVFIHIITQSYLLFNFDFLLDWDLEDVSDAFTYSLSSPVGMFVKDFFKLF